MITELDLEWKNPDEKGYIEIIIVDEITKSEEYVWLTKTDLEAMLKSFEPKTGG